MEIAEGALAMAAKNKIDTEIADTYTPNPKSLPVAGCDRSII